MISCGCMWGVVCYCVCRCEVACCCVCVGYEFGCVVLCLVM